ncbi:methionyl-tRNA formyltransferase [Pseudenhygromyxa sp. WMMC2535]|nr:methionyl-tRNA formyltransferase [Pseudenhygromyxa sp. WMMC2535]NVB43618.1 methionyl-tRNA formyltransferase [Pseudenhygromyxa sp. WMMC2535]
MGSPDFALPSLRAVHQRCELVAVVSQPDRPAGRGRKLKPPPVKVLAESLGVPVLQPTKVRKGRLSALLEPYAPEIIVVTAYGRILGRDVLELPAHGCVNVHASLLPRWRGAAPIQRAVLAGDAESGVAIMRMDIGCDTGPVYRMRATPIGPEETAGALFERLAELGGEVLGEFLAEFPDVPPPVDQAELEGEVVHAAKLEKAEGEVDWSRPARAVIDHVRGMDPWPAAWTSRGDQRLKLYAAGSSERARPADARPGQVLEVDAAGMHVCAGDAVVRVGEVQAPGKRRMAARDYASGQPFAAGDLLGAS